MMGKLSLLFLVTLVAVTLASRNKPRDCEDVLENGHNITGVYKIFPEKQSGGLRVWCDMDTDGGGWTVIQRRISDSNFYQNWDTYERGFGSPLNNYWLGNLPIFKLTDQDGYQLRIDMRLQNGTDAYALYNFFKLYDVRSKYQLLVNGYSGDAGNSIRIHNGRPFSTKDRDHDAANYSCATSFKGGCWYESCHHSNLNGLWGSSDYGKGINWFALTGHGHSLARVEMKIRVYRCP